MIDVNEQQRLASNPFSSVWVAASAGSGKTKVLTDRVLNLLLMNSQPEKILCLTFTKTAAAEMSNRINDVLKSWAVIDEHTLIKSIEKLTGDYPDKDLLDKARKLFAMTLETPGGMKIMTIHSFCQSVLRRFPLEADITPHFEVMDETSATDMLTDIMAASFKNPALKEDIALLSGYVDEAALVDVFKNVLNLRGKLFALLDVFPNLETVILNLKKLFNIEEYHTENEIKLCACDLEEWDEKKALYILSTGNGIKKKYDGCDEAMKVFDACQKINQFNTVMATHALLKAAYYVLEEYQRQKRAKAVLDYDDLIEYTKKLLEESDKTAWVLYKLDGGIDHILVDEAQDTNPDQWSIIRQLAEEFFAGEGRSDVMRTIFAVGDKKQSIYSFQGADPDEFERMRTHFEQKVTLSENDFKTVPFNFSFRSTPAVLDLVNFVLKNPTASRGVLDLHEDGTHLAYRKMEAGLVEIWPLEKAEKTDEEEGWKPPIERVPVQSPVTRLAQKIARKIKQLIEDKEILESAGRPVKPGDFLILVQRRRKFVSELVRFLKEYHIPVAGVDRLILTDHIAVQDLIALAKFVLLPEDDLNLATVLKSPLIGLMEEDVFKVCYNRGDASVWDRVRSLFPPVAELLSDLMDQADKMPPFEFFSYILSKRQGRKNFVARLGEEVHEALDEFLNLTLTFEKTQTPSLQTFLKWVSGKDIEIKRDLDQSSIDAVRIMTVHGAKGLQGNIVFLPDTRFVPKRRPSFLLTPQGFPIWFPKRTLRTGQSADWFERYDTAQIHEYRRLLYVAITRPKDRLYICGWDNKKPAHEGNWYDLIVQSVPYSPDADGIIRFSSLQQKPVAVSLDEHKMQDPCDLPQWVYQAPAAEPQPPKPLSPSRPSSAEPAVLTPLTEAQENSMRRGTFIHQLLQYLPTIDPEKRRDIAYKMKPDDIDIPENIFTLLSDNRFKDLFGPTSLAEVPVVGVLNNQVVSGQIDRLVVTDNAVKIIDYKSNKQVPNNIETVPESYKVQLRTYKALLKNIFPDKIITAYLLWTQNLTWMEIE